MSEPGGKRCCMPAREGAGIESPGPVAGVASAPADALPTFVALPGGTFRMGTDDGEGYAEDGEGPARRVTLSPFSIGTTAVTNAQFREFVRATRYITDAESFGSSFVFLLQVDEATRRAARTVPTGLPWWLPVEGACWQRP